MTIFGLSMVPTSHLSPVLWGSSLGLAPVRSGARGATCRALRLRGGAGLAAKPANLSDEALAALIAPSGPLSAFEEAMLLPDVQPAKGADGTELCGIGLSVARSPPFTVMSIADDSPAAKARPKLDGGDELLAIDGAPVANLSWADVRTRCLGPEGSEVCLSVRKLHAPSGMDVVTVPLRRARAYLPPFVVPVSDERLDAPPARSVRGGPACSLRARQSRLPSSALRNNPACPAHRCQQHLSLHLCASGLQRVPLPLRAERALLLSLRPLSALCAGTRRSSRTTRPCKRRAQSWRG